MKEAKGVGCWLVAVGVVLLAAGGLWWSHDDSEKARERAAGLRAAEQQRRAEALNDLAAKYGARADWDSQLQSRFGRLAWTFTADLQRALLLPNQQPIAFRGRVLDVAMSAGGEYRIVLAYGSRRFGPNVLQFVLTCSAAVGGYVIEGRRELDHPRFDRLTAIVVAQIDSIRRANASVLAEIDYDAGADEYDGGPVPLLEIEMPDTAFAFGRCLALVIEPNEE